jgi:lipid-A-disaccharide synthase
MNREVVKELVQFKLNEQTLFNELNSILPGNSGRDKMLASFDNLRAILGTKGASERFAKEIVNALGK